MYIKDKDGNYVPTPSSKGADGREVSLRVANNYIQWRYPDTEWTNLVPLSDLKGEPGTDGIDGREVHMRVVSDTLQWRLGDSGTWQTLMSLSTVTDGAAFGGMVVDKTLVLAEVEAGDADISLGLTAATPGQIIKVKTVQDGKPTEWEAVDMPSGDKWEKIKEITIAEGAEESNALTINADENGNTFRLKKARLCAKFPAYTGTSTIPNFSFAMLNGKTTGRIAPLLYTNVWPKISTKLITGTVYYVDVSGTQQIEHAQRNGNSGWSDDTTRDYTSYGSAFDSLSGPIYGDTLWAKPITSIGGSGMLIYPGCHFVLYGVRE